MAEGWRVTMTDGRTVAAISMDDLSWLGRWRTLPGVEVCEAEGHLWVRCAASVNTALLPAVMRYTEDAAGRLYRAGNRLPARRLPEGRWVPLVEFLRVRPPAPVLPAQYAAPVSWSLVPSQAYRIPSLLVLPFPAFAEWCLGTVSVRLQGLEFALGDDGMVCVRGQPLPSLPGEAWCLEHGIATPAGWALPTGITAALVAQTLNLEAGEIVLLQPDATADRLPAQAFVKVSRTAVRASLLNMVA